MKGINPQKYSLRCTVDSAVAVLLLLLFLLESSYDHVVADAGVLFFFGVFFCWRYVHCAPYTGSFLQGGYMDELSKCGTSDGPVTDNSVTTTL